MKKIAKLVASSLVAVAILSLNSVGASAEWKKDNVGWIYSEGNYSHITGWKLIDGNWYYFNSSGYMAHDTTIDGYYLNSSGAWKYSDSDLIDQELIKNISIQNPHFYIKCYGDDANMQNIGNIFQSEINKLKVTNSYEMFNVNNYNLSITRYGSGPINITIDCTYKMNAQMEAQLDVKARSIVEGIAPNSMSQAEKERAIHDWIINNTRYDQSYSIYDPYNTLIKHTGVCEGYSLLAQKMFTIAGIKSIVVEGKADGQDHAWNLVYIDGKWRHVDCTWDDPVSYRDVLQYDYYNLTDEEISNDHTWDSTKYPEAN
ncbi:transglutaminase domain-containing protein [Clostridium saccharoperbutylacetonicum]